MFRRAGLSIPEIRLLIAMDGPPDVMERRMAEALERRAESLEAGLLELNGFIGRVGTLQSGRVPPRLPFCHAREAHRSRKLTYPSCRSRYSDGAPGRTRTNTPLQATDFESAASTISPLGQRRPNIGTERSASTRALRPDGRGRTC